METTVFFARFWGSFLIIFGALAVVVGQLGRTIDMAEDRAFVISTGYTSLLMGLVTVILHNVWVWEWPLAITVLGWGTLIKGITKVGFPQVIHQRAQRFRKNQWVSATFLMLAGAWLLWMSFA